MGMADVATVLFSEFLKFDPQNPSWPDRDRFVISNGHGCMLLYSLLFLTGYDGSDIDEIKKFRQIGSRMKEDVATRKASGLVLEYLTAMIPEMIGGSADLTPSNNVKAKNQADVVPQNFSAKYIHYGVREHGMAATMNGIALHGGFRPYGGTTGHIDRELAE
jgi:transketolase